MGFHCKGCCRWGASLTVESGMRPGGVAMAEQADEERTPGGGTVGGECVESDAESGCDVCHADSLDEGGCRERGKR